jgi:UbiD family decarboxylase
MVPGILVVDDLRSWLDVVDRAGELRHVIGADPDLDIGVLTEINCGRRGPALLFDEIPGYRQGYRILTSALLNATRLGYALGYRDVSEDAELVSRLEHDLIEYDRLSDGFQPTIVEDGPVLANCQPEPEVDLTRFPAPLWHEDDGGRYLGTGCIVITRDPDTGIVNFGSYRVMIHDANTVTLHISPAHHGAMDIRKHHARGQAAPVAVSLGHHPLFLILGGMTLPYGVSEYQYAGAIAREPVPVVSGRITGMPIPAASELAIEGLCHPDDYRDEGPFGEFHGYYSGDRGKSLALRVKAAYHRDDPINLGAMPGMPPHDYTYMTCVLKSAMVSASLKRAGLLDVRGVWYQEAAAGDFFIVISLRQRYAGHARQVAHVAAQCQTTGSAPGRYVVVVDDDIDPTSLEQVVWAISTRSNPERDVEILRNTYSSPVDPMYGKGGTGVFGSRAIIDACRPFDSIERFPRVARATAEARKAVSARWQDLLEEG